MEVLSESEVSLEDCTQKENPDVKSNVFNAENNQYEKVHCDPDIEENKYEMVNNGLEDKNHSCRKESNMYEKVHGRHDIDEHCYNKVNSNLEGKDHSRGKEKKVHDGFNAEGNDYEMIHTGSGDTQALGRNHAEVHMYEKVSTDANKVADAHLYEDVPGGSDNQKHISASDFGEPLYEDIPAKPAFSFKKAPASFIDKPSDQIYCRRKNILPWMACFLLITLVSSVIIVPIYVTKTKNQTKLLTANNTESIRNNNNLVTTASLILTTVFIPPWTEWSACDTSCDFGLQQRSRSCAPELNETNCVEKVTESRSCTDLPPCPAIWGYWAPWGACDKTCGGGNRTRSRPCTAGRRRSDECQGHRSDMEACNDITCPDKMNFTDCTEIYEKFTSPGVYKLQPEQAPSFNAYCDQGWTVIMKRYDGSQDFYLKWADYKSGFGNLTEEHWLGNDHIHSLTSRNNYSLRFDFMLWPRRGKIGKPDPKTYFAQYDNFKVESEVKKYKLHVSGYKGNTGFDAFAVHNNQYFTTPDRDNDRNRFGSCSKKCKGSFWYNLCADCNPTGKYESTLGRYYVCMFWRLGGSSYRCMKELTIKIQPRY